MAKLAKLVEVTFRDHSIKRFIKVLDDSFEKKDQYIRFKNMEGETIYIHQDTILMFSTCDDLVSD